MGIINDYLEGIRKRYPNTKEVREQIDELRDTLHLKAEEYQAQGRSYDEAARDAVASLGDVTPLLDQVSGNMRSVYINRLNRNNALLSSGIILCEFLLCWLIFLFIAGMPCIYIASFGISASALALGIGIWPVIACLNYRRRPEKTNVIDMPFCQMMRTALLGWLAISILLAFINLILLPQSGIWFAWPLIGISNWPLNIFLYYRQLKSGHYDAEV